MSTWPVHHVAPIAGVTAALLAGCGGGSGSGAKPSSSHTTSTAPAAHVTGLAKPVYPRCGVERFAKPQTAPLHGNTVGQYWQVSYILPSKAPQIKGAMSLITLLEQSPELKAGAVQGGQKLVFGGQTVSFRKAGGKTPQNVVQWRTAAARYIMIVDGPLAAIKRLVSCLP